METWRRIGDEYVWVNTQTMGRIVSIKRTSNNNYAVSLPGKGVKHYNNLNKALKSAKSYMRRYKYG